jgi:hypothetical protein
MLTLRGATVVHAGGHADEAVKLHTQQHGKK